MTTFSVVATPIGNLEDITLRALNVLRKADLVLCEDTRVTKKLLDRHDIHAKTMSYHARSELSRTEEIIQLIKFGKHAHFEGTSSSTLPRDRQGKSVRRIENDLTSRSSEDDLNMIENIVLVSDAGTPGISDPGSLLVRRIRDRLGAEIDSGELKIEAIPGPSALVAALSIAGVPCADFTFLGFLPHKKGRQTLFKEIAESERTMVFYESPHRIMKTLEALKDADPISVLAENVEPLDDSSSVDRPEKIERLKKSATDGSSFKEQDPEDLRSIHFSLSTKRITVCRELTKIFEEVVSGTATEVLKYFETHPDKVRGEFVVIVSV